MKQTTEIWICMGSSCYARGNARNAEIVREWIDRQGVAASITFAGTLCEGRCREGPIMRIDDRVFTGVTPSSIEDILDHVIGRP
jgi:NADH:ubiquinone oxidoreductase subunit E